MAAQVFGSIYVGLAVSAVLFLPLVVWQYRRYGRFDALRMLWTAVGFVYVAAIAAFTVFPLPEFTPGYCTAHATSPLLDPLRFPKELLDLVRNDGPAALLTDWLVWEFALNIVLFIPFGLIVRRVLEWSRGAVLAAALGTSLLIELTQLTGNWGLAPCPYRFADITDLFTNTTGALLGIGLERITPRLLSTKAYLLARRDDARPVTRGRRLLGMLLDTWFLGLTAFVGATIAAGVHAAGRGGTGTPLSPDEFIDLERSMFFGAAIPAMVVVVLPALIGTGASLGQRTVYIAPVPLGDSRWWLVLRALSVQGLGVLLFSFGPAYPVILTVPLALASLLSIAVGPRGISCGLARCRMTDSRTPIARATQFRPRELREAQ